MEPCKSCSCGCIPVSSECVVDLSEIPGWNVVRSQDISNAVDDIDDLIGDDCATELCDDLSAAITAFNDAGTGVVTDYMSAKWLAVIQNKHFKKWFANRVAWHWFEGSSITELKKVGLVTSNNNDEQFRNGFQHAEEAQRKRLQQAAANYATGARKKFLRTFWFCDNDHTYGCIPTCECNDEGCYLCNKGEGGKGRSIGMDVI